ncbi:MAG: 2-isopropylmalate synthase [Spirochaetia bacterium]
MGRYIKIFDTTLRDGEQSPGASMTLDQKVEMAEALESLGVDVIEAGFPVSSKVQFEAVRRVAETLKEAAVVGLSRCVKRDIDVTYDAVKDAVHPMLHLFIATSPLHREFKLKKDRSQVLESIATHLDYASQYFDRIEFSPEDASRTETDFLLEVINTAIAHGATTINIPDTVGFSMPDEFGQLIEKLVKEVPEFQNGAVDLSVHCHNDLGLAAANSLAAVKAGASQVEVTLNGIGERAGNCALEELVMGLEVRRDLYNVDTRIKKEFLYPTGKLLQNLTGLLFQRNKPIFGDNVFTHESGIHQHGVLAHRETYEIMNPNTIGRHSESLVMGRHSGKHALQEKLRQYNIRLSEEQFQKVFERFAEIADKKKEVFDEDLFSIVSNVLGGIIDGYRMPYFHVYTGNTLIPSATIKLTEKNEEYIASATGDGPVDAVFNAIDKCCHITTRLEEYIIQAVGSGKDAQGQVKLMLDIENELFAGKASSTDIVEASALAYLNAVNRYVLKRLSNGHSEEYEQDSQMAETTGTSRAE